MPSCARFASAGRQHERQPQPAQGNESSMKVLRHYFASELLRAILFVLLAFLMLFAFFDLLYEFREIGRGGYDLPHALLYVALAFPSYAYELMPIAVLIGSVWVLAQFA